MKKLDYTHHVAKSSIYILIQRFALTILFQHNLKCCLRFSNKAKLPRWLLVAWRIKTCLSEIRINQPPEKMMA